MLVEEIAEKFKDRSSNVRELESAYILGGGIDNVLSQKINCGKFFRMQHFFHDSLGSVVNQIDDHGLPMGEFYYDAFGVPRPREGGEHKYRYTSRRFENKAGLYYYRSRWYMSEVGRFISRDVYLPDPMNTQGLNAYSYVQNNPLKWVDPFGERILLRGTSGEKEIMYSWLNKLVFGAYCNKLDVKKRTGDWIIEKNIGRGAFAHLTFGINAAKVLSDDQWIVLEICKSPLDKPIQAAVFDPDTNPHEWKVLISQYLLATGFIDFPYLKKDGTIGYIKSMTPVIMHELWHAVQKISHPKKEFFHTKKNQSEAIEKANEVRRLEAEDERNPDNDLGPLYSIIKILRK